MAYPNPSNGMIDLFLPEKGITKAEVECYAMNGKRLFSRHLVVSPGLSSIRLDFGSLAPGLYLLRLITGTASYTDRIMIR